MVQSQACMANLRDLASLSKTINEKSDEINRVIEDVEHELALLRLGVETWLGSTPLAVSRYRGLVNPDSTDDQQADYKTETHLGYARHGQAYALVVKDVRFVKTINSWGHEIWEIEDEEDPKLLTQSSRALRVEALNVLDALFDRIKIEAERVIASIENGRRAVEELKNPEKKQRRLQGPPNAPKQK